MKRFVVLRRVARGGASPRPRSADLRGRHGGRGPDPLQPAPRARRRSRRGRAGASTSSASTPAGGRSRPSATGNKRRRASTPATTTTRSTTGPSWTPRSRWCAPRTCSVMLTLTGPGPLWSSSSRRSATRAGSRPEGVRGLLEGRGDALPRPGRPLPDLERAQPEGLAAAAVGARSQRQVPAGLPAHLPLARARRAAAWSRPPTRAPRS